MDLKEMLIRLSLAVFIGGLIGLERERSYQFAGFRTHILISLGSCIVSIMSLQLYMEYNATGGTDVSRLTAQVLSGIGFLGAGAILKTSNGIKGLTTAAGMWVTACIGIVIGYGYYRLALLSATFVMVTLYILKNIDKFIFNKKHIALTIRVNDMSILTHIYNIFNNSNIEIKDVEVGCVENNECDVTFFIVCDRRILIEELIKELNKSKNVINVDYLY